MAAAPCKECGRRPKIAGRHRCLTCQLRHEPIGDQVAAARRRLAMVPEELRRKRTKTIQALAPAGTAWCAGCQSFRDLEDFGKGATACRACVSAKTHTARIAKVYGLDAEGYQRLLDIQQGKCAICGNRPKSKRLAVDHDHGTGEVRGLLCDRDNHDLLGAGYDSPAKLWAALLYLLAPPASGRWSPLDALPPIPVDMIFDAQRPSEASGVESAQLVTKRGNGRERPRDASAGADSAETPECTRPHYLPNGAITEPGKRGVWRVWVSEDSDPPF